MKKWTCVRAARSDLWVEPFDEGSWCFKGQIIILSTPKRNRGSPQWILEWLQISDKGKDQSRGRAGLLKLDACLVSGGKLWMTQIGATKTSHHKQSWVALACQQDQWPNATEQPLFPLHSTALVHHHAPGRTVETAGLLQHSIHHYSKKKKKRKYGGCTNCLIRWISVWFHQTKSANFSVLTLLLTILQSNIQLISSVMNSSSLTRT